MAISGPGSVRLRTASLAGVDIRTMIHEFKCYSSIFRPYKIAEAVLIDTQNFVNSLDFHRPDPFEISFDSGIPGSGIFTGSYKMLSVNAIMELTSYHAQAYLIKLVDDTYFENKKRRVTKAFQNVPGTQIVSSIASEFLGANVNVLMPSQGLFGTKEQPYIVQNEIPLPSIAGILKLLYADETGNFMYFQNDRGEYIVSPLKELMNIGNAGGIRFTRNPTVGRLLFGGEEVRKNAIELTIVDKGTDNFKLTTNNITTGTVFQAGEGILPTFTNMVLGQVATPVITDNKVFKNTNLQATIKPRFQYAAKAQDSITYNIVVYGDFGGELTAGEGISLYHTAPTEGLDSHSDINGNALIATSTKYVKFDGSVPAYICSCDCIIPV